MTTPWLVHLSSLLDDATCFELVRQHRWPDGVRCPHCNGPMIARDGHDDTQRHRPRYRCKTCDSRVDDLTGTVLAGHHQPLRVWVLCLYQPLRVWVLCLYLLGLKLSNCQIAPELDLAESDVQVMTEQLRTGITTKLPPVTLDGVVEADAIYGVAGHKGNPVAVTKTGGPDGAVGAKARPAAARWTPGRGTLDKEKPPILGLIPRGGEVVLPLLANVQQTTIRPILEAIVARDSLRSA